jgi:hypothetical protein
MTLFDKPGFDDLLGPIESHLQPIEKSSYPTDGAPGVVASKGMRVEETELAEDEAGNRDQFIRHLKNLGVRIAEEAAPAPAKKGSKR